MELARLKQLKLEQQYIKKKKQAQIEAELIENELQIAIAQSKLEVFSKTDPMADIPLVIPSDNSYVNDYVAKHSTPYSRCSNQGATPSISAKIFVRNFQYRLQKRVQNGLVLVLSSDRDKNKTIFVCKVKSFQGWNRNPGK